MFTVDNGTSSRAGVEHASLVGHPGIAFDHHLQGETFPAAESDRLTLTCRDCHFPVEITWQAWVWRFI
ncbi:hypothetical protein ACNKHL_17415 [Shigella flexneri]